MIYNPRRGLADAKRLKNLKSPHAGGFRFGGLGACHQQADIRARARISLLAKRQRISEKALDYCGLSALRIALFVKYFLQFYEQTHILIPTSANICRISVLWRNYWLHGLVNVICGQYISDRRIPLGGPKFTFPPLFLAIVTRIQRFNLPGEPIIRTLPTTITENCHHLFPPISGIFAFFKRISSFSFTCSINSRLASLKMLMLS